MRICPNKSSKEWKSLSSSIGESQAELAFIRNGYVIPSDVNSARELITNVGVLKSLTTLAPVSSDSLIKNFKERGLILETPINKDGKIYFEKNIENPTLKENFDQITKSYGSLVEHEGDLIYINKEAVKNWNNLVEKQTPKKDATELAKDFLASFGIDVKTQDDVISRYGSNGVADIAERMVLIQSGMEDVALPEEAMHFFIEMLDADNPALSAALDKVRQHPIYAQTLEKYKDNPNYQKNGAPNYEKIRKEALAKLLAEKLQSKDNNSWWGNLINAILDFIKNLKIQKSPEEMLLSAFINRDARLLNANISSNEVYNQLTDENKKIYESRPMNDNQKDTLNNLFKLTHPITFNEEHHRLQNQDFVDMSQVVKNEQDLDRSKGVVLKSVTSILGSDFYSDIIDNPINLDILVNTFSILEPFRSAIEEDMSDKEKGQIIIDILMQGLIHKNPGDLSLEEIEEEINAYCDIYGEPKTGKKLAKLIDQQIKNNYKTKLGSAVHFIVESLILHGTVDVDKIDPIVFKFMDHGTLTKLISGTIYESGIVDTIKKLIDSKAVLLTEFPIGNSKLGGIVDLVAIHEDGTVEIFDFKTKFINELNDTGPVNESFVRVINQVFGNVIKNDPDTLVPLIGTKRSLKTKYAQQLSLYKKLLMEAGIPVSKIQIIGIPYTLNEDGMIEKMSIVPIPPLSFDENIGNQYFGEIEESLDKSKKQNATIEQDERLKKLDNLEKQKLKESFANALAKLTQLSENFRTGKLDEIKKLLSDPTNRHNKVDLQISSLRETLTNYDDIIDFLTLQQNFLEMIDSSIPIIKQIVEHFDALKKLTPTTSEEKAQRSAELLKAKNFLVGYGKIFENFISQIGTLDNTNPVVSQLSEMIGIINSVNDAYIKIIMPDIAQTLGETFNNDLIEDVKRAYNELIIAARQRGDKKRVEALEKERDEIASEKVITEILKGNKGDTGWFFSKLVALSSNPDIVLAGVAKKLKRTLDRVRIINKDFRDRLDVEFEKRAKAYQGKGIDLKEHNKSLVYTAPVIINRETGETINQLFFRSEHDELIYHDLDLLRIELDKAIKEGDKDKIKVARKNLKDFEQEFFKTDYTDEWFRLTAALDKPVTFEGKEQTVREITNEIWAQRNKIEQQYSLEQRLEGKMSDNHVEEIRFLMEKLANLKTFKDEKGNPKTGDALTIAEALEEADKNRKLLKEDVEQTEQYNAAKQKIILKYGKDSDQLKEWLAYNSVNAITPEFYARREEIFNELTLLQNSVSNQEIKALYREISKLKKPYLDENGNINGNIVPPNVAERIKELEKDIEELRVNDDTINTNGYTKAAKKELNQLYTTLKTSKLTDNERKDINKRINELISDAQDRLLEKSIKDSNFLNNKVKIDALLKELGEMSKKVESKYYLDEKIRQEELFADSIGITRNELISDLGLYEQFKDSDWYQQNHILTQEVIFEDKETDTVITTSLYKPIDIWTENVPDEKYVMEKPGRHFYKTVEKESYVNENGETIQLINKDNRDIKDRLIPKSNSEYRAQYGKDHKYINKDFANLKARYENKTATFKEIADYENLLFIHKELLDAQKDIEFSQRLGFAVPFMEKHGFERGLDIAQKTVGSGGKNVKDAIKGVWDATKRAFVTNENDINEYGLGTKASESSKLATIDNNEVKFVPVRFTGKGDVKSASYDVWGALLNYVGSTNRKKELEKEITFLSGLEEVLGDTDNQPKSGTKNKILSKIYENYLPGLEAKINLGTNTRLEVLKSFINSVVFNEENFSGYDVLGINTQKAINVASRVVSTTMLGMAPFNWTVNWMSGNIQNMVEAAGGAHFGYSQYLKAKKIIYGSSVGFNKYGDVMKDMMTDYAKVGNRSFWGQIIEYFDPVQGDFENEFGEKTSFNKYKNIFQTGMFAGKVMGEWEIQMSAFIAFMLNQKVYNGKVVGKETFLTMKLGNIENMSLKEISAKKLEALKEFDALENNLLDIMELKNGKLSIKDQFKDVFELGSSEFSDVVAKLHAMQKKINGSYAKFDKTYVEKTSLGKMAFFFRKYLIPLGINRLGARRVDYEEMKVTEGFYLTFLKTVGKDLMKLRFKMMLSGENYSDQEKEAIKKTLTDLMFIFMTMALLSLLGWDPNDNENMKKLKEAGYARQASIFILMKIKSETEQFVPHPSMGLNEIVKLYKTPSILLNQATETLKMSGLLLMHGGELFGMNYDKQLYYQKDVNEGGLGDEGDSKLLAKFMKSYVGYSGKTFHPIDAIKSFRMMESQ